MSSLKEKMRANKEKLKQAGSPTILAGRYEMTNVIGSGVSSTVYEGTDKKTTRKVAIKKINKFLENKHESLRLLREIILLRILDHPNIIKLREVILLGQEPKKELYLVLDYFPTDMRRVFKSNRVLNVTQIKIIVFQILCGLDYCHQCQVLHRDLKPENILTTQDFSEITLCDFGLARAVVTEEQTEYDVSQVAEKEKSSSSTKHLSAHVTTRWYRAPELIILQKNYTNAIDMWSVGCILAQLMGMLEQNQKNFTERKVLFPGKACYPLSPPKDKETSYKKVNEFPHSVHDQLSVIFDVLGTPEDISFVSDERARSYIKSFGKIKKKPFSKFYDYLPEQIEDFMEKALQVNPGTRIPISEALKHPMFDEIRKEFEINAFIKGEPVITDIENLSIEEIRERFYMQYEYYQKKAKEQGI